MIHVLFALRRESQPFRRVAPAGVQILETGVGQERTRTAIESLRAVERPQALIAAGYCGALVADLSVGDVVVASEVLDTGGGCWPTTWRIADGPWRRGRMLTSTHIVGDPKDKQSLGEKFRAVAADMESAAIARFAAQLDIPFACVRAVSDEMSAPLSPQLVAFLSDAQVSVPRVLAAVARRPKLVGELLRLSKHTRFAADRLSAALARVVR